MFVCRYESPVGASPSRNLDSQKPFYEDEMFDRSTSYRGSVGKSIANAPSYNGKYYSFVFCYYSEKRSKIKTICKWLYKYLAYSNCNQSNNYYNHIN